MTSAPISSQSQPWAVAFDERLDPAIDATVLLGGKGAGLLEMTQALDLPVPPGFVITTEVCRRYMAGGWPGELDAIVSGHLERLGAQLGAGFGDPERPLLVAVRSGAAISMPGMMDTLLNVGMTPAIRAQMAARSGSELFAADTWLRFCRMYAEIVLGLPREETTHAAVHDGSAAGALAAADRIARMASGAGTPIPVDPKGQLRGAIEAVFRSWKSERAQVFRAHEGIPESLGTAVTVQAMVFGNADEESGTGVVFTRDPATGDRRPVGDYLPRAQGEDVVAGTHIVHGLGALAEQLPAVHSELMAILDRLEHHYGDMCDVEFTVSGGRLFVLQTRIGRRSPLARVRIAVALAEDPSFDVDRAEAVARVDVETLHELGAAGAIDGGAMPVARGLAASPGVGAGVLCLDADRAAALAQEGTAVVLAREATSPEDVHGMIAASAIVTTKGGVVSHAAVVARSWSIPAVTSLEGATIERGGLRIGAEFFAEGEAVTVDGSTGAFYRGDCRADGAADVPEARVIREWAAELQLEPGMRAASAGSTDSAAFTLLDLVRTVQLKGLCGTERAAAYLSAAAEAVAAAIAGSATLFRETPRGHMLSPEGREWLSERLAEERAGVDVEALETCYAAFEPLNGRFKLMVTEWQLLPEAERSPEALATLGASMAELHSDFEPIVRESAVQLPRLAAFGPRFEAALAALQDGDASMLASPMKESYHTLWFDFHEELIALTGRDRAEEQT